MGLFRRNKKEEVSVTEEQVLNALKGVKDPDLHRDIVSLNFIKNVEIKGSKIKLDIEVTTPSTSVKDKLQTKIQETLGRLSTSLKVETDITTNISSSMPKQVTESRALGGVKNIIAVSSGKGGVGKSTVSVNLAMALARTGAKVGLMDADVYGPSVPKMLSGNEKPVGKEGKLLPIEKYGLKFMSMALLTDKNTPVIWRGPMATKLIQQFLGQVLWGELDYLLIDLPPGTGDVQLTLTQSAPLTGAVIVTTPQEVALEVTMRGIRMFDQVHVPILGLVENMSGFVCGDCGKETPIFTKGGAERTAKENGFRFLGRVPLDPRLALASDAGKPLETNENFDKIAEEVASEITIVNQETANVQLSPKEITNDKTDVVINWSDETTTKYPFRRLRLACRCAECIDEWTGEKRLDDTKITNEIHPRGFQTVGRYALRIMWSDGHSSGIYTFNHLLELSKQIPNEPKDEPKMKAIPLPTTNETSAAATNTSSNAIEEGTDSTERDPHEAPPEVKESIVEKLKTVFDPEIPVNVYDLGLIYGIDVGQSGLVNIQMTLTAPACPAAESLPAEVKTKAGEVDGVAEVNVELVWDPPWDQSMMSEVARVQLGL